MLLSYILMEMMWTNQGGKVHFPHFCAILITGLNGKLAMGQKYDKTDLKLFGSVECMDDGRFSKIMGEFHVGRRRVRSRLCLRCSNIVKRRTIKQTKQTNNLYFSKHHIIQKTKSLISYLLKYNKWFQCILVRDTTAASLLFKLHKIILYPSKFLKKSS